MRNIILLLFLISITSCYKSDQKINVQLNNSKDGIVSSAQPLASKAGVEIMRKGGNAIDAAVASAFVLSVVEPSMSGIGGRLQVIFRLPNGEVRGIDASTQVPELYDPNTHEKSSYGYSTIGIPGVVAGLVKLNKEYGRLPLETVMQPAIKYASEGFKILPGEAMRHAYVENIIGEFVGTKKYFLDNTGNTYKEGNLFIQQDLSKTLKAIAENGKDGFYSGVVAERMVQDIQENGGILTMNDLKNYKAIESRVLKSTYRGHEVNTLYLPSFGAITIEILNILENFDVENLSDSEWIKLFSDITKLAYKDRPIQNNYDSLNIILSKGYAKQQANKIHFNNILSLDYSDHEIGEWVAEIGHTTHLSTADKEGYAVSLTQTVGPLMGSKVASDGLGFIYAVTLGGYLGDYKPGDRANSHISPTIITKKGDLFLALGAAGGSRIITAITQVISNVIDKKMSLFNSLTSGRVFTDSDSDQIENHKGLSWDNNFVSSLDSLNFPYKMVPSVARFGRVHAIKYDETSKEFIGAADPDWEGSVENIKYD